MTAVINSKAQGIRDQERILGGVTYPIQLWDREQRVRMGVGLVTYPPDHHLNNGLVHMGGGIYHKHTSNTSSMVAHQHSAAGHPT